MAYTPVPKYVQGPQTSTNNAIVLWDGTTGSIVKDSGVPISSLGMAIGGSITGGTEGSVLFIGAGPVLAQDNANFFWDDTNDRLGLGTTTPEERLELTGNLRFTKGFGAERVISISSETDPNQSGSPLTITAGAASNSGFLPVVGGDLNLNGGSANFPNLYGNVVINANAVTSGGNVVIGAAIPTNRLDVNGAACIGQFSGSFPSSSGLLVNGIVGIAEQLPAAQLHVQVAGAGVVGVLVRGDASEATALTQWQLSSSSVRAKVTALGAFSNNGIGASSSEIFGDGASVGSGTTHCAIFGNSASAGIGSNNTIIGGLASVVAADAANQNCVVVGKSAIAQGLGSVAVGASSVGGNVSGSGTAVGYLASAGGGSVALGISATATAGNSIAIGTNSSTGSTIFAINVGASNTVNGNFGKTFGYALTISSDGFMCLGNNLTSAHFYSIVMGQSGGSGFSSSQQSQFTYCVPQGTSYFEHAIMSTVQERSMYRLQVEYATNTDASRKGRATFNVADASAFRECIRIESDGSAAMLGVLGASAVVRQASGANLTNNVTSGGTDDTIANYTDLVIYANDAATIRNDIYQLARKLKQINDALRLYGLLT